MKKLNKIFSLISIGFILLSILGYGFVQGENFDRSTNVFPQKSDNQIQKLDFVPGEILVKFKESKINLKSAGSTSTLNTFSTTQNLQTKSNLSKQNMVLFQTEDTKDIQNKINQLNSDPNVEYAQPNYIYRLSSAFDTLALNDTYIYSLRGLEKIQRGNAFYVFSGNVNTIGTIVAVLDAGVAYAHPDLAPNMRDGSACLDYQGNALNNCQHGYDFLDEDKIPYPVRSSHGTHVAGTIAAQANNGSGIVGVNPNAKIMAIRAGDDALTTEAIIKGIDFARYNGAKIINASFGGTYYDTGMYDAINNFRSAGGLFVTAAGNGNNYGNLTQGDNHDTLDQHVYPCDFTLDNIICVAATDSSDNLATFSDYGITSVDVGAPGVGIYSTTFAYVSTTGYFEDREAQTTGIAPSGWTTGGSNNYRGIRDVGGGRDNVLFGDLNSPYLPNIDTTIEKTINLSNYSGASISFWTRCDTEYNTTAWTDYMYMETSPDGVNYTGLIVPSLGDYRRDEVSFDNDSNPNNNVSSGTQAHLSVNIPGGHLTNNFRIRFGRHTNSVDNDHEGCMLDDIKITLITNSGNVEIYESKDGTSMASPHVAGLASLAWSSSGNLSYSQIRDIIINSGDSISSLAGKTVSGKRINAANVLTALGYDIVYRDQIFGQISSQLSGQGIRNNLSSVLGSTVDSFSGLYFAQMSGSQEMGRITFHTGLDLTDTGTQNFLSGELPNSIGISQGQIRFNPGTGFINKNATLKINLPISFSSILNRINSGSFIVREGSGGAITGNNMITSVYSGACVGSGNFACPIYLDIAHFTSFQLKPQLVQVNIKSNNSKNTSYAKSGDLVTLSFTGSEALTGVSLTINGMTGLVTGSSIYRYSNLLITSGTSETSINFSINFANLSGTTGNTVTLTTDSSTVIVDNTPATLGGATSVTNTNTQTPTYSFTSNEAGTISYSGACTSTSTGAIAGANNITFSTLSNATYSGCRIYVKDRADNESYLVVPTFTVNYTPPSGGGGGGGGGGSTTTTTTSNPDLDDFYLSVDDTTPAIDQRVDLTIEARDDDNDVLEDYNGKVEFRVYYRSSSSASWTETSSSSYFEIKSSYKSGYTFKSSDKGSVVLNNFIQFKKEDYDYKLIVEDRQENISKYKIFYIGEEDDIDTCSLSDLICSDGKYKLRSGKSCEGGKLGNSCTSTNTGGSVAGSRYTKEFNDAYLYAYKIGITTMPTVQKANMYGELQRSHMAKMMVNYASGVLGVKANTNKSCNFTDIGDQNSELRGYIKLACQMGLMGVGLTEFRPTDQVLRAEFGTVLSRAIRGTGNDQKSQYYQKHLNALKTNGIMSQIDNPWMIEKRGYVMIMLMRAEEKL